MIKSYHANGKLLLSGEYLVLHGAKALALPVNKGQSLLLKKKEQEGMFRWSATYKGKEWFFAQMTTDLAIVKCSDTAKADLLRKYIQIALDLNPDFQEQLEKVDVETRLDFDPGFGLGSSSTFISLLAQWSECNPFELHFNGSKGSGYDIACAVSRKAIIYQLSGEGASFEEVDFNPPFKDRLYFAYLGKKQDSTKSVDLFLQNATAESEIIKRISEISLAMVECTDARLFGELMKEHESIIATLLNTESIRDLGFSDLKGEIKSLGAWGGDFIMINTEIAEEELKVYLSKKGIQTMYTYKELEIK